jgi:hypothetical protein
MQKVRALLIMPGRLLQVHMRSGLTEEHQKIGYTTPDLRDCQAANARFWYGTMIGEGAIDVV